MRTSLLLFGRLPRPGRVKTRLADQVGDEQAAIFYRLCAEHLIQQCQALPDGWERFFCYADAEDGAEVQRWVGPQFCTLAQVGEDLGQRLAHALAFVFRRGAEKAVVMATDVPDLSAQIMVEAMHCLDQHDVVLGPCSDGGYYLLGAKRLHRELFAGIPWSTDQVLDATLSIIRNLGLSVAILPVLGDIDTAEDLREWQSGAAGSGATDYAAL